MTEAVKIVEEQTALTLFEKYLHFSKVFLDAYAVVDISGKVVKANQMFAQLTGTKMKALIKANSFDELLNLSVNDDAITIEKILENDNISRMDEVSGCVPNGEDSKNLIIGIYPLIDDNSGKKLGAFLMLRDVTAETNLQGQYKDKAIKSITDPLTGLYTRGHFDEYLPSQVKLQEDLASDARTNISLVMCDIDFFKKVNDTYGHQAGDYVLKVVAKLMMHSFRKTDVCCRYGGEEFLVVLPSANETNAALAANKFRTAVADEKIVFEGTHIPITISCGVGLINIGNETYEETMTRADSALYKAKEAGRNMVCLHDGDKIIETKRD